MIDNPLKIQYYPSGNYGYVYDYFEKLIKTKPQATARLMLDLKILGAEGLQSKQISIRSLGSGLWELKRRFEGIQYRIFFCIHQGNVWLLHSIEKKSSKTPISDMAIARKRMKEVVLK